VFTKSNSEKDLTVSFGETSSIAGNVKIKAGTFKPGCVLKISGGTREAKTATGTDCDDPAEPASVGVSLQVSGPCSNSDFKHPVTIQLYSRLVSSSDSCFGFTDEAPDSPWECLPSKKELKKEKDYSLWQTETDHFT